MVVHSHFDEARQATTAAIETVLACTPAIEKTVLIDDVYGHIRVIAWVPSAPDAVSVRESIESALRNAADPSWIGDVWIVTPETSSEDRLLYDTAWNEGVELSVDSRVRRNDRHRNRTAWFVSVEKSQPAWPLNPGPPIVVFHSFKGGVGRTTAVASYAIARARRGQRVAVVDMDLDAPGLGLLLDSDGQGTTARWGVVDFFLEAGLDLPLTDYLHVCGRDSVGGEGVIEVFPAGMLDDTYLTKLARVDLEIDSSTSAHPLRRLLDRIRSERQPDVLLVDGRAGLSPAAGLLLSGFAHLHVLFATASPQSLKGLERVVRHLGYERARRGHLQHDCVVVQAMVPDSVDVASKVHEEFAFAAESIFREGYYAKETDPDDELWSLSDIESSIAPHVPVPLTYRTRLAFFRTIDEVAPLLAGEPDYARLTERLDVRLGLPAEESPDGSS
jgi:cellulose biosynthesis protein BcsQ